MRATWPGERVPVRYVPSAARTAALLLAWACVVVGARGGRMPLGAFPLLPFADSFAIAAMGWAGVVLPVAAGRARHRALYAAGLACLAATWGVAFAGSELPLETLFTGLPFVYLLLSQLQTVLLGDETPGAHGRDAVGWPRAERPRIVHP